MLSASARPIEEIKLTSNSTSNKVEVKFKSKYKKNTPVVLTVINAEGKVVSTQSADVVKGDNTISLINALELAEGTYTVQMKSKKKTYTTQFIIWK